MCFRAVFSISESATVLNLTFAFVCNVVLIKRYHTDNILLDATAENLNKYIQNFVVGDFFPPEHANVKRANVQVRFR